MFNLDKYKTAQVTSQEKYLRRENIGPKADNSQAITEKEVPHREGNKDTITEDRMKTKRNVTGDAEVIEKVLNEAKSYVTFRSNKEDLPVPPGAALVEKMRQNRMAKEWDPQKKEHWSQTFNEKKQQGSLPKFPKNAPQHDKIVLNNDPRRFEGVKGLPTHEKQTENDRDRSKPNTIKPLVGDITKSDIDRVVYNIKTGQSLDYDTAMVAILREADKEKRELTPVERKAITELKIARTNTMIEK